MRPSTKVKDMIFWTDVYMPLSSSISGLGCPSSLCGSLSVTSLSNGKENSSASSHDSKDESEIETKPVDAETDTTNAIVNETESDMETIASDKQYPILTKTRSCENVNLLEENGVCQNELSLTKTRHCSDPNLFVKTLSQCVEKFPDLSEKCVDILKLNGYDT